MGVFLQPVNVLRMSLQWNLVAGFLYSELAFTFFLLVPFISNRVWSAVIEVPVIRKLERFIKYYFYVVVVVMILAFLDSIREMQKYADKDSAVKESGVRTLDVQMQHQMRLFRAQRNFYIVGFTLFLCLVIRRLLALISSNDTLQLETDALVAAGRDTDKIINEDALKNVDQDACKNLQKRIANAKSVTKSAVLTFESLQEKCTHLQREI